MRSSSTQIANQISVCWRGVLGCVDQWVQQPTSQPNEARQKRNWPLQKGSIPGDSIPTMRTGHAIRYLTTIRWRETERPCILPFLC